MPIFHRYDPDVGIVRAEFVGVIDLRTIQRYLEEVLGNHAIDRGFVEVGNMERAEDLQLSYIDAIDFKEVWQRYLDKGCVGSVLYAPTDLGYGLCRMIQSAIDPEAFENGAPFHVVRSEAELQATVRRLIAARQSPTTATSARPR